MKYIIIVSIAFFLLISSCKKKLDITIPKGKEHIVVNGITTKDSLIKLNISKSQNILDNNAITNLDNATVKLYNGETFIENLTNNGYGNYVSEISPEIGKQYNISVSSLSLKPVKAKMQLIEPTQIVSIDTTIDIENDNNGGYYMGDRYTIHYKINFKDNENTKNYYFLSISTTHLVSDDEQEPPVLIDSFEDQGFSTNDIIFNGTDTWFSIDNMKGQAFTDELINGSQYAIDVNTSLYIGSNEEGINNTEDIQIKVKLLSISEDIYKYIVSYNLNKNNEYDPFAQPVQIFTNIENGLGLFSGYTMDVDSLNVDFLNK